MKVYAVNSHDYVAHNTRTSNNNTLTFADNNYQKDSVSFTGRYPKGNKKIEKVIKDTTKPVKRHIKNSAFGEFAVATQKEVENIHESLKVIQEVFGKLKSKPVTALVLREEYGKLITKKGMHGIAFKLSDNKSLKVQQLNNHRDLVRLIVTEDGKSTYYMLAGYNKAVSNLNQSNPNVLPQKLRYMTVEEIKNSPIKQYISIANKELKDYSKYLSENKITNKLRGNSVLTNKTAAYSALDMIKIFNNGIQKLPEQAKPIVSPTGNLVGFKMPLLDGAELFVSKKMSSVYGSDLTYLSIKETTSNGIERYLTIDCATNDFLKTRTDGKPIVINNNVYSLTPAEMKENNTKNHFNRYMDEITKSSKSTENNTEISVLKTKTTKNTDIDLEQIEDINITKQIEKEITAPQKAEEMTKDSDLNVQKSIKEKAEEFSQNISNKLAKLKEETASKAKGDAKILADTYFQTFIEQFQTSFNAKVTDFTEKFQELFKSFGK